MYNHFMTASSAPRSVLVTGGTGGIGAPIAQAFADVGANVAISSRHARPRAEATWTTVRLELEEPSSATSAVQEAVNALGGLDTLVVNAVRWPTTSTRRFEDLDPEDWQAVLRANIEGAFAVTQ